MPISGHRAQELAAENEQLKELLALATEFKFSVTDDEELGDVDAVYVIWRGQSWGVRSGRWNPMISLTRDGRLIYESALDDKGLDLSDVQFTLDEAIAAAKALAERGRAEGRKALRP